MKYKALFCDLDGTILDTLDDLVTAVNTALKDNGFPTRSKKEVRSYLGYGSDYLIKEALPSGVSNEQFQKVYKDYKAYYKVNNAVETIPYPGMEELLTRVKASGMKLAIITNKPQVIADILANHYFPGIFDLVLGQSDKYKIKPDPEMMTLALKELDLKVEDVFFIGDSLVDMQSAINMKMNYALVSYGFVDKIRLEEVDPKHVIDEVGEIWPLIA